MSKIKSLVITGAALATAAMAQNASIAPDVPTSSVDFSGVITYAAPICLAVVASVAGLRVVIKLINRAAGK